MLSQLLGEEGRYRGGVSCVLREAEETVWGTGSPRPSGGRLGGTRLCRRGEGSREGETGKAAWTVRGILWKLAGLRWRAPEWGGGEARAKRKLASFPGGRSGGATCWPAVGSPGEPLGASDQRNEVQIGKRVAGSPRHQISRSRSEETLGDLAVGTDAAV